jgi:hypothetical protein
MLLPMEQRRPVGATRNRPKGVNGACMRRHVWAMPRCDGTLWEDQASHTRPSVLILFEAACIGAVHFLRPTVVGCSAWTSRPGQRSRNHIEGSDAR